MTVKMTPASRRARRRFVAVERTAMRDEPLYVPELRANLHKYLRGRSAFYEEIDHTLFVAENGRARCAAMINRRWQRDKGDDGGFIGYFAAAPDAASQAVEMLAAAERWLAGRGAAHALGPFNGAAFHGVGYDIDLSSARYRAVSRRALADARCMVRPIDKKRWAAELETVRTLFNETFRDEWEFHAMTPAEFRELFDQFKLALDPRLILIAEVDGEAAGFCIGLPGWTQLFRSLDGRLGPRQVVRFLRGARHYDTAGLLAIGVRDAHRAKHIGQTLAATLYRTLEERGLERATYLMVNDHNLASRRLAESLGGRGRVLYTVYDKELTR